MRKIDASYNTIYQKEIIIKEKDKELEKTNKMIAAKDTKIKVQDRELKVMDKYLQMKDNEIEMDKQELKRKDDVIRDKDVIINIKDDTIKERDTALKVKTEQLAKEEEESKLKDMVITSTLEAVEDLKADFTTHKTLTSTMGPIGKNYCALLTCQFKPRGIVIEITTSTMESTGKPDSRYQSALNCVKNYNNMMEKTLEDEQKPILLAVGCIKVNHLAEYIVDGIGEQGKVVNRKRVLIRCEPDETQTMIKKICKIMLDAPFVSLHACNGKGMMKYNADFVADEGGIAAMEYEKYIRNGSGLIDKMIVNRISMPK